MTEVPGLSGIVIDGVEPGTPEWRAAGISASRVAAIMGVSPYESLYSLWHQEAGLIERDSTPDEEQQRGHYLEPAIAAWFADRHPEWAITASPAFRSVDHPRIFATPDRLVLGEDFTRPLEIKSAARTDLWGEAGTDEIPPYYRAQTDVQMLCTGADGVYVAMIGPYLEFQEFYVPRDDARIAEIVTAVNEFLDSLPGGPAYAGPPPIDTHKATYDTVKALHPDIEAKSKVELDAELVEAYRQALKWKKDAEDQARWATARVADAMGSANYAVHGKEKIARRQSKKNRDGSRGTPYVVSTL